MKVIDDVVKDRRNFNLNCLPILPSFDVMFQELEETIDKTEELFLGRAGGSTLTLSV